MKLHLIPILIFCFIFEAQAQTQRALDLRNNVVAISAQGQNGFGFITGSRYDQLFVVTAAHVVEYAVENNDPVDIKFYNDYRRYKGNVIRNYPEVDIALLEVKKPEHFSWNQNCLGNTSLGVNVAFIGRDGDWYVPRGLALGTVFKMANNQIQVDITSVRVGSSGGPLITDSGIVGMIVETDGGTATAVDLNELRTTLSEYPYFFGISNQNGASRSNPQTNNSATKQPSNNILSDRDGNTYSTKVMKDGKRWMTKNLNIEVDNSWCYKNDPANCKKYGRLYTWEAAKEACALLGDGWRLPTDEEWDGIRDSYGGAESAYKDLLGNGSSGFAAQLGGLRGPNGDFNYEGYYGYYWSSTPNGSSDAWRYCFSSGNGKLDRDYLDRARGYSVRCLQGAP